MKIILISMALGLAAGIVDILPMMIKKLDILFVLSALALWIVVGVLIPFIQWTSFRWLNGLIAAALVFVPTLFLIIRVDPKALPQILITTVLLSTLLGFLSRFYLK